MKLKKMQGDKEILWRSRGRRKDCDDRAQEIQGFMERNKKEEECQEGN